jgi:hypothetical protein
MSSTDPPRTPAERAAYLRQEMDTVLYVAARHSPGTTRHPAMPEVRLLAVHTMDRAATAPVVELQVEAFIGGILEIMQLCLERNHLQGTDLADVYRICETALARIIDSTGLP